MSYSGKTYKVDFKDGGFSANNNIDAIKPTAMLLAKNITLNKGGRGSRGGSTKVNSTAVSGAPRIMGLFDFQLASSAFQVFGCDDGKLYKNSTTTIKTAMSTANHFNFEVFDNELYICDGDTVPQTWDGSAAGTSDLTTPSADWTGSDNPFQAIAHGRGASRRMWYLFDDAVYYSTLSNAKEVSGGTSGKITFDTGDAVGLKGAVEFGDRLFVFSRNKSFVVDDSNADKTYWGYQAAQWGGGAAHWRLIVKTENDVVVMTEAGDIYSVLAAQEYGDYKLASLTKPAFMDRWIQDNVRLGYIDHFHAVYDPTERAIYFNVVLNGETTVSTSLVYYVDRNPEDAWVIHDNTESASGYDASCSAVVRISTGVYKIYTGDYLGFIRKLNQSSKNDDSGAYYSGFKTPYINLDDPRTTKLFKRIFLTVKAEGAFDLQVKYFIDGQYKGTGTVSLAGAGDVFDTGVFDTATFAGIDLIEGCLDIGETGKRIQVEIFNTNADEDFFVSAMLIDFKPLGRKPE